MRRRRRERARSFFVSVVRREKIQTRRWRDVDATKTTTHLRGDGRKVPGIRGVLRQNGLGAIIARRGDERVYERHDTLRRAQKKNEDQEKGTPLPLFPNKGRKKLYTNRENNTMGERNESQKYHTTRVKQKEKERRRRRKRRICAWTDTKKENTTRGRRVTTVY